MRTQNISYIFLDSCHYLLSDPLAPAVEMYQEVEMMEGVEIVDHSHTRAAAVGLKHLCLFLNFCQMLQSFYIVRNWVSVIDLQEVSFHDLCTFENIAEVFQICKIRIFLGLPDPVT